MVKIKKKKKLGILLALMVLVLVIGVGVFLFINWKENKKNTPDDYPIVYLEDTTLYVWDPKSNKKIALDSDYSKSNNRSLKVAYGKTDGYLFAYLNDEVLYFVNVSTGDKAKVASEVTEMGFSSNDEYLIYIINDTSIYSVNLDDKEKVKLASNDGGIEIVEVTEDKLYYLTLDDGENDALYVTSLDGNTKEKLATDVYTYNINDDKGQMVYAIKDDELYDYYLLDFKTGNTTKIIDDGRLVTVSSDFQEFFYVHDYSKVDVLVDDASEGDIEVTTTQTVCSYSYYIDGLCTYEDWLSGKEVTITLETSKKEVNDAIREAAEDTTTFGVYYYKSGKEKLIVDNITSLIQLNTDNKAIFYTAIDNDKSVNISELDSVEDFNKFISSNIKYYYLYKGDTREVIIDEDISLYSAYISNDGTLYITDQENEFYQVNFDNNSSSLEKIGDKLGFGLMEIESGCLVYNYDYDSETYTFNVVKDGKTKIFAENVNSIGRDDAGNLTDISYNCKNDVCTKALYQDGKIVDYAEDAYEAVILNNNLRYVIKNYSEKNETYDIYRYVDGELKQLAYDIPIGYSSIDAMH